MRKLLSANFARLWKNKAFWLCTVTSLVYSVISMMTSCYQIVGMTEEAQEAMQKGLDACFFNPVPVLGFLLAVFVALFMGTEYSDGTIRNKIITGHTRTHIYLANFVVCFVAGLCFTAAWLVGGMTGIPFLGVWRMSHGSLCILLLVVIFFMAAFTGIFTILASLSTNKALTGVYSLLLMIVLLMAASYVYQGLAEPEMLNNIVITENGMQMADSTPNPNYLTGTVRTVYEWILDLLPTGQSILMSGLEIAHPFREMLLSALVTLSTVGAGLAAFKRKNLN